MRKMPVKPVDNRACMAAYYTSMEQVTLLLVAALSRGERLKMREILFRGKNTVTGRWEYGSLCYSFCGGEPKPYPQIHYTNGNDFERVDPATVGQYIGLTDKNGKQIFEGDIIRTTFPDCSAVVTWDTTCARFIGYTLEAERCLVYVGRVDKYDKSAVEVIGNIHDNPELLEGTAE
jgi:uncharacterized phage protein (TIGR01671 family)